MIVHSEKCLASINNNQKLDSDPGLEDHIPQYEYENEQHNKPSISAGVKTRNPTYDTFRANSLTPQISTLARTDTDQTKKSPRVLLNWHPAMSKSWHRARSFRG